MCAAGRARAERGQATPEWLGLVLVVAIALAAASAALLAGALPGAALARAIAARLVCAIELSHPCHRDPDLVSVYGSDLAAAIRAHAPGIAYEPGMRALPVDYRICRTPRCADGPERGVVIRSNAGERVVVFVHVVDCRTTDAPSNLDCSGDRAGNLYLQYWLYFADSATLRSVPVAGSRGYHRDDWESFQVRIGPDGDADVRASSHSGYNYDGGARNWGSDAGIGVLRAASEAIGLRSRAGWGDETGWLFVSGGSHAGRARGGAESLARTTPRGRLLLIPLEPIVAGEEGRAPRFAVTPPWLKDVWFDPEADGTG